jgi:hypothetical protein
MEWRRHKLNEHYFDRMDTAEKWYWYGFILADGCVFSRRDGRERLFQLRLAERDRTHLEEFSQALSYEGPIRRVVPPPASRWEPSVTIAIYSRALCTRLLELGLVQRKSFDGHPLPSVPAMFTQPFVRGHFDANGYASVDRETRNFNIGFSGTPRMMRWLHAWIRHVSGVGGGSFSHRGSCGELKYRGNRQVRRLATWLYDAPGPFLVRKRVVLEPLIGAAA